MPQIRDILVHISATTALKQRKCHRTKKHVISSGTTFLLVRNSGGLGSKNYCPECAKTIMDLAEEKIITLKKTIKQE